jgi:hypothetical protein
MVSDAVAELSQARDRSAQRFNNPISSRIWSINVCV